jgi:hypothetical protein
MKTRPASRRAGLVDAVQGQGGQEALPGREITSVR